jgi:uncharacterized protein
MNLRETAWRVFARELNASKIEVKPTDEYSPAYILSPLGAQINRVFVVGVLTDVQNVGEEQQPLWRAKVADPSGIFYISAGKYQPRAAQTISQLEPMTFVAVVGKARTYSPHPGTVYVSVRPELVTRVDPAIRSDWFVQAAESLKSRLDYYRECSLLEEPNAEKLNGLGVPEYLIEGMLEALHRYDDKYVEERFRNMLIDIIADTLKGNPQGEARAEAGQVGNEEDGQPPEAPSQESEEAQTQIMMLISHLAKEDEKVMVERIKTEGRQLKMKGEAIEDALATLLDKGVIFEPEIGYVQIV